MQIKVLGPGCPKCQKTAERVQDVVTASGVDAQVIKITDVLEIARFGVLSTPAVVVDGKVKSSGKIPDEKDVLSWIKPI
jgi:small redox-active disulfide protein 2